jgi:hypothetical protein
MSKPKCKAYNPSICKHLDSPEYCAFIRKDGKCKKPNAAKTEIEAIATVINDLAQNEKNYTEIGFGKIDIIQADFDTEDLSRCSLCDVYYNILVENKNKFDVRLTLVIETRGSGDKQQFIYKEQTVYAYLKANETKTLAESFYVDKKFIEAGNGITFNVRMESAVK